jgi:hypothetical protein
MIRKFQDGKVKVAHEHDTGIAFRVAWERFACLAIVNCELKECGANAVKARLRHMPVPSRNTAQVVLPLYPAVHEVPSLIYRYDRAQDMPNMNKV